jgi:hypothetical protein
MVDDIFSKEFKPLHLSRTILKLIIVTFCIFAHTNSYAGWTGAVDNLCGKAVEQLNCSDVISGYPEIYGLTISGILTLEAAGIFNSSPACQSALNGRIPEVKDLVSILDKSGNYGHMVNCACKTVFDSPSCSNVVAQIANEIASPVKGIASEIGFGCEHPKIDEVQYNRLYLAPLLDKYALATEAYRQQNCYAPTGECWGGCYAYYRNGSAGCRMKAGNASYLCDVIVKTFANQIMARQPVLVAAALPACMVRGDGCAGNTGYKLLIDTYSSDAKASCLNALRNEYPNNCKPNEQPCCRLTPLPEEIKCKKAQAQAPSMFMYAEAQIRKYFEQHPDSASAPAKLNNDRKACRDRVVYSAKGLFPDEACQYARVCQGNDISVIWKSLIKTSVDKALHDAKTQCDDSYENQVNYYNCVNICTPETIKAYEGPHGKAKQCISDCMIGKIGGNQKPTQAEQEANCISNCQTICQRAPTKTACENCKKPNWCGPGTDLSVNPGDALKPQLRPGNIYH